MTAGGQKPSSLQCYECGAYGHYRSKCPARSKGGSSEALGRDSRGKNDRGNVAVMVPTGTIEDQEQDADVGEALERVMATMHSITSADAQGKPPLGQIPMSWRESPPRPSWIQGHL